MANLVPGSLAAVAAQRGISLAETFLSADAIVMVDVSGSMEEADSRDGQTRYQVACQELAKLQRELPGKIAVVAFSSDARFVPGGVPPLIGAGTDLAAALHFVRPADGTVDFWIISDGEPQDEQAALDVARHFTSRINAVYVGPRGEPGADFLRRLARGHGGWAGAVADARQIAATVLPHMLGAHPA